MAGADEWWHGAEEEARIAALLHQSGFHRACYHHTGQSLEFALKAIYLRRRGARNASDVFRGANWHSLGYIATHALSSVERSALQNDRNYSRPWRTVIDWDSNLRFPSEVLSQADVNALFLAAFRPHNGVLSCLEKFYLKR